MNMDRYLRELSRLLSNGDFGTVYDAENERLKIDYAGAELCAVFPSGQIRFQPENIEPDDRHAAFNKARDLADRIREYVRACEKAPALKATDLQDGYRQITEHNGIVLAAKDMREHGFEFVTWLRSYDGAAVGNGNYFTDYDAAKKDFAVRSGLIDKKRVFSDGQLENIYRSLSFTRDIDDCLTFDYEQQIKELMRQIEGVLPYVKDATPHLDNGPVQGM